MLANLADLADAYATSRCTWKRMKSLFFDLMNLAILNSFIILNSYGSTLSHQHFRL
jgi:hypothetical protein